MDRCIFFPCDLDYGRPVYFRPVGFLLHMELMFGCRSQAVDILKEVVRIAPNVADSYHTLGLLYDAKGDRKKALNFYMIAAHLTPKDIVLWKRLASWSM